MCDITRFPEVLGPTLLRGAPLGAVYGATIHSGYVYWDAEGKSLGGTVMVTGSAPRTSYRDLTRREFPPDLSPHTLALLRLAQELGLTGRLNPFRIAAHQIAQGRLKSIPMAGPGIPLDWPAVKRLLDRSDWFVKGESAQFVPGWVEWSQATGTVTISLKEYRGTFRLRQPAGDLDERVAKRHELEAELDRLATERREADARDDRLAYQDADTDMERIERALFEDPSCQL